MQHAKETCQSKHNKPVQQRQQQNQHSRVTLCPYRLQQTMWQAQTFTACRPPTRCLEFNSIQAPSTAEHSVQHSKYLCRCQAKASHSMTSTSTAQQTSTCHMFQQHASRHTKQVQNTKVMEWVMTQMHHRTTCHVQLQASAISTDAPTTESPW